MNLTTHIPGAATKVRSSQNSLCSMTITSRRIVELSKFPTNLLSTGMGNRRPPWINPTSIRCGGTQAPILWMYVLERNEKRGYLSPILLLEYLRSSFPVEPPPHRRRHCVYNLSIPSSPPSLVTVLSPLQNEFASLLRFPSTHCRLDPLLLLLATFCTGGPLFCVADFA